MLVIVEEELGGAAGELTVEVGGGGLLDGAGEQGGPGEQVFGEELPLQWEVGAVGRGRGRLDEVGHELELEAEVIGERVAVAEGLAEMPARLEEDDGNGRIDFAERNSESSR